MGQWWSSMETFQQVLFIIACATTLFMLVQIVLMLIGSGDNDFSYDTDTDIDGGDSVNETGGGFTIFGLRVFSIRSIVAFFSIGCWLTFALFYAIGYFAIIPGVAAGIAAAFGIAFTFKSMEKMQEDGTLSAKNTVGKIADVYLTVPASGGGHGKVSVLVQERYAEYEAVTNAATEIKTGAKVRVISILNEGTLMVEPISKATQDKDIEADVTANDIKTDTAI